MRGVWALRFQTLRLLVRPLISNALQFLFDNADISGSFICIHLYHLQNQRLQSGKCGLVLELKRCKMKWRQRRVISCEQLVEHHTKAIDIGTRCCLCPAILLWGGIAGRAEGDGISGLPWLEIASYAKVNQRHTSIRRKHHICRFEVTKNDGWLARVQIFKHYAE